MTDFHERALKAWETRGRAIRGTGSNPNQIREDVYAREQWSEPRTFTGAQDQKIREHARRYFRREFSQDDVADLAGAPPGSEVEIELGVGSGWPEGAIGVEVRFPDNAGSSYRIIDPTSVEPYRGTIYNQDMTIGWGRKGRGIGSASFELEVESAAKHGFESIRVTAVGKKGGATVRSIQPNGYYTWARLGFESEDPVAGPNGPTSLTALMSQPGGASWWKENGKSFFGIFDLRQSSTSMRVFNEYRRMRRERRV